ncbi:MarR family winged helix-turn-helix transcriptional regulator [Actinokineospora diospyrosa]|uniref:DNA-binding transcriptional regulator, MarR family n=1 Tax=Actinokineospora diospyrosa TaxID=103728 RepID=A0ABT1IBB4_9PSEU|nr:MarR family transcriptional regulator [Actinokineospora diospyrosa]MCP2269930.1 DNA-binding transcriptional regulator, MarR family [Actinokineospora diospyrosa]
MPRQTPLVDQWRSLTLRYNEIACRLDRELGEAHGISMNEFETLDRLVAHECESLRMLDLAAAMYLSQSALSRTVARLERAGLVERALCEADRRGVFVHITAAGRARHGDAARTHLAILGEHLETAD